MKPLFFLLVIIMIITAVSAGGYAPVPIEEHQTAAQAEAIAGALVGFRGTYAHWLKTPVTMDTRITVHRSVRWVCNHSTYQYTKTVGVDFVDR